MSREQELVRLTPSGRRAIAASRSDWGVPRGRPVLMCRSDLHLEFGTPGFETGPVTEFTSRGIRCAVPDDQVESFRGAVLSYNHDALFGTERWGLHGAPVRLPSLCSDPLGASCCPGKFRRLHPELFGVCGWLDRCRGGPSVEDREQLVARTSEHLRVGDSRAAIVIRIAPLTVAAYCDEHDAVVLLRFPRFLAADRGLSEGDRLVTVNLHRFPTDGPPVRDIRPGPRASGKFTNVCPLVADFLAAEEGLIDARRRAISAAEWQRCQEMGDRALQEGQRIRAGQPLLAGKPA